MNRAIQQPITTLLPTANTLMEVNKALGLPTDKETIRARGQEMLEEFGELRWKILNSRQQSFQEANGHPMNTQQVMTACRQADQQALDIIVERYVRAPLRETEPMEADIEFEN